jgi:hypothetical protein
MLQSVGKKIRKQKIHMLIPSLLGENLVRNRRGLLNMLQSVGKKAKIEDSYADSCVAGRELSQEYEAVVHHATICWQKNEKTEDSYANFFVTREEFSQE